MILKYSLAWVPMVFIAIANGAVREKVYGPRMKELTAHQVSCVSGIILFTLYTFALNEVFPFTSPDQAILIGLLWLALTLVFEFTMILWIMKEPMERALAEYNLLAGRLWVLVLAAVVSLPWVVFQLTT